MVGVEGDDLTQKLVFAIWGLCGIFFFKTHVFSCLFLKTASLLEMTQEKHDRILRSVG